MGSVKMENWKTQYIDWKENDELHYFKREMKKNIACKKMYYAHIFICDIENEEQLRSSWQDIISRVAVYVQSNIESLIERSNFYVCFFTKDDISLRLQNEIEEDTFCAKKYIFSNKNINLKDKCTEIEKKNFFNFSKTK